MYMYWIKNIKKREVNDMKVVFVCHGNTCRSPMAEAIFKSLTGDVKTVSAGLYACDGEAASPNAVKVCKYNHLDITGHRAKSFENVEVNKDDLVLTLTCDIRDNLRKQYPNLNIHTIKEYAGEKGYLDINDPIGGDILVYEDCFYEIKECIEKIIENHKFIV